jgi:catechol 2,3-dioxygenase-like lactoylglutathione lyase family enzyme
MAGAQLTVTGLDHIVLRVRDLDAAIAFYSDILGLPIECLAEYRAGDGEGEDEEHRQRQRRRQRQPERGATAPDPHARMRHRAASSFNSTT